MYTLCKELQFMNISFKHITSDRIFLLSGIGSVILIVLSLLLIGILYTKLPPFLPLFNQMSWGVARIGTKEQLFIPTFIATVILLTNTSLALYIYDKIPLVSRMLCVTSLLIAFFVLLFTIRTIQIII